MVATMPRKSGQRFRIEMAAQALPLFCGYNAVMLGGQRWPSKPNKLPRSVSYKLKLLVVLLLIAAFRLAAQVLGPGGPSEDLNSEQLLRTAESYEKFLHQAGLGTSQSAVEVQEQLGAVYYLLHRYNDSLAVLKPVLRAQTNCKSPDSLPGVQTNRADASKARTLEAQSWLVSGLDYLELNQLPDATRSLRQALAMQPDSANARLALGDALARSGRMQAAAREYEDQTRLTPSLADAWYKLGLAHGEITVAMSRQEVSSAERSLIEQLNAEELLAKGDNLNAARTLFRVLRESPSQPEVHAQLGSALLALGYVRAAQGHFQQELVRNPESPLAHLGLVQTAALENNWSTVTSELERLSGSNRHELMRQLEFPPAGLVVQAWSKGQMNGPPSFTDSPAGAIWKSWLSDSNVVARISEDEKSSSAFACTGQKSAAMLGIWLSEQCYSALARQLKSRAKLTRDEQIKLIEAEFRLGSYAAALGRAKLLHAAEPHNGWALYWLSKSHDALAEACFLKVAALNPDSARVHQMLAEHYSQLSDYPKAKSQFQQAIRLSPASPDLHLGLGTVLSRSGDLAPAEKELKTTLELSPKSAFAHYELGHLYVQENQWPQAIDNLRQVPEDSTALLNARLDLAKAESALDQNSAAINDLCSVEALDKDGEVYYRLASLYRAIGDTSRAHDALITFKQRRAASLQADTEEIGALEKEQENSQPGIPQRP
jgi:tetratricopeptide (TPR) repeat protein